MTDTPLAPTVPYDPGHLITGKRRVALTSAEEETYAAAFMASLQHGYSSIDAGRVAWLMLQENCPRLREYDAAERSNG
jgi:hypothetical protein